MFLMQCKAVFAEGQQTFVTQFTQFAGHGTAVNRQKIGKLLAVERNGKAVAVLLFCLGRKIAHQLLSCGTFGQVVKLLHQLTVFGRDKQKQVVDNLGVIVTGHGTGGQHAA